MDKDKKKKLLNRKERNQLKNAQVKVNPDSVKINAPPLTEDIFKVPPFIHNGQRKDHKHADNDDENLSDYENMLDYLDDCSDFEDAGLENTDEHDDELDGEQEDIISWSSSVSEDTSSYTLETMNNVLIANRMNNYSDHDDDDDYYDEELEEDEIAISDYDLSDVNSNGSLESLENEIDLDLQMNNDLSSLIFEDVNNTDESSSDLGF
ncbi:hypothetical protein O3M35_009712 [Rhynocoris fuscipes]|uniref:Uncharacterized protein n=1 Tax=Rhynocoris fuscipes TaxID=488301 RepID=A0AAW1D407_9HEMI